MNLLALTTKEETAVCVAYPSPDRLLQVDAANPRPCCRHSLHFTHGQGLAVALKRSECQLLTQRSGQQL